ncbi:DUF4290 domain-containing protein [Plebeiibacterium marinum]|uniref:DUF4290 domain-containing protein n=1 Tax=Plebeiibacterium marinum TaxID=2992111 RepID=A0AAE3MET6_9BACT|nr:DUF4290 domain-containing protein [Plebeiobacterium marinum]MCW3806503.1 DUF4290 domain-containing protein [Plebeiobacterium marinum]
MDYNSNRKKLLLPEYGRHIQKMVDYCVTIEDLEEKTKCAHAIIGNMGNMFPHLRDVNDFKHKLWDHLAIMSDFKLGIETPFELPEKQILYQRPDKMPYSMERMRYRHYGRTIEKMIDKACEMEEGDLKRHLMLLIANNMKKSLLQWNKDFPGDERVFSDMIELSGGRLVIPEDMKIPEHKEHQNYNQNQNQNRNKKKRQFKKYDDRR